MCLPASRGGSDPYIPLSNKPSIPPHLPLPHNFAPSQVTFPPPPMPLYEFGVSLLSLPLSPTLYSDAHFGMRAITNIPLY